MLQQFIKPVLTVIAVSLLVWILFWIIFKLLTKKKGIKISSRAALIFFLFYMYIIAVLSLTIIPLPFTRFKVTGGGGINLIPVVNIVKGCLEIFSWHDTFSNHTFQNIFGNIILFIPLGIFPPLLSNKYRSVTKVILLACICSVSIELSQLVLRQFEIYRTVDVDDVILNTSGAFLGFIIINKYYFHSMK